MEDSNLHNTLFPIGYHCFNKNEHFNFQLNRIFSLGYADFDDLVYVGKKIHDLRDWNRELKNIAEKALIKGKILNSAFYYHLAEYYLFPYDCEKKYLYNLFNELFYDAIEGESYERYFISFKNGYLPVLRLLPEIGKKGTIVLNGGFDSCIEEFYSIMTYFSKSGFEVIGFDGCGQGAALRKYNLNWNIKWEEPVKAILDYFKLNDITLLGMSTGGWLSLRASAFDQRIKRVVGNSHLIDYRKCTPLFKRFIQLCFLKLMKSENPLKKMAIKKASSRNINRWLARHTMFITGMNNLNKAFEMVWSEMNEKNIRSDKIIQDVLLIGGKNGHLIRPKCQKKQVKALINAKSVTSVIFTKKDCAEHNCQIGNVGFSLNVIIDWIEGKVNHAKRI